MTPFNSLSRNVSSWPYCCCCCCCRCPAWLNDRSNTLLSHSRNIFLTLIGLASSLLLLKLGRIEISFRKSPVFFVDINWIVCLNELGTLLYEELASLYQSACLWLKQQIKRGISRFNLFNVIRWICYLLIWNVLMRKFWVETSQLWSYDKNVKVKQLSRMDR